MTSRAILPNDLNGQISFRHTPLLHDSSIRNVPVCRRSPGLPHIAPQAEESAGLVLIKGGPVGAESSDVPTNIFLNS